MKQFNDENFLLETSVAQDLYHNHAAKMPIIDYHCHLIPEMVANDHKFKSITELWLGGDHYKWRAMRTNGVDERFCTGKDTSDWEKFEKWAETITYCFRNPLYHWSHLELKTAFGITKQLSPKTAREIFDECNEKLKQPEFSARGLMRHYNVECVCTTDDPVDDLRYHKQTRESGFEVKMIPAWRPDKAMNIEKPEFPQYVEQLSNVSGVSISNFKEMVDALQKRHDFFHENGCRLSDHGIEEFYDEEYTDSQIETIFSKAMSGQQLSEFEIRQYKNCFLTVMAEMDADADWTQQFHYGAIRDNNTAMYEKLGPDTGFDSIGEFNTARAMSRFLNKLNMKGKLTRTILYTHRHNARQLPGWRTRKDSVWLWMVVQRPARRHDPSDERSLCSRSAEPLRRYAHRLSFVPELSSPRVFPSSSLQHSRQRCRERSSPQRPGNSLTHG